MDSIFAELQGSDIFTDNLNMVSVKSWTDLEAFLQFCS